MSQAKRYQGLTKENVGPGVMVQAYIPTTQEVDVEGQEVQVSPSKCMRSYQKLKATVLGAWLKW